MSTGLFSLSNLCLGPEEELEPEGGGVPSLVTARWTCLRLTSRCVEASDSASVLIRQHFLEECPETAAESPFAAPSFSVWAACTFAWPRVTEEPIPMPQGSNLFK